MFGFRKKDKETKEEKEKRKREKKEKKELKKKDKDKVPLTQEELERLEEAKKGLFRKSSDRNSKRKDDRTVSGPVGDARGYYDKDSPGSHAGGTSDSSSTASLSSVGRSSFNEKEPVPHKDGEPVKKAPKIPPKPPAKPSRGILKGKSNYGPSIPNQGVSGTLDDSLTLTKNTLLNEVQSGKIPSPARDNGDMNDISPQSSPRRQDEVDYNSEPHPVSSAPKERVFDVDLKLPVISPAKPPRVREVTLKRQPAGDFGFTLRRGTMLLRVVGDKLTYEKRNVIFAEPGGGQRNTHLGLLPGDRLIEVNGVNVEESSREEIIDMIKKSGDAVVLKVQPIPELSELSLRSGLDGVDVALGDKNVKAASLQRSGSLRFKKGKAKSEDQVASEKAWLASAEQVWLVHRNGFAGAQLLKANGASAATTEGKCKIKLDHGGQVLEVDEEEVEKRNPPSLDRAEDLASLRYLNESGVLHTLRQRYGSNLIHTYAGPSLLIINPMHPLSIYSEKVIQMFKGCKQEDMPPHVYASAQTAYRTMLATQIDQSLVFMGRSGSGKSTNAKHVLHYLIGAAGSIGNIVTVDKINAASVLLEEFGNSRTCMNTNASRYTQITSLEFDVGGQIASASIQVLMLDKSRAVRRPEGEPSFHIFYQMLAGMDAQLRSELQLQSLNEPNLFMTPLQRPEDRQRAAQMWSKVLHAMHILAFTEDESKAIFSVIAAIYHLGVAGATKGANNKNQFAKPAAAQKAATLLGTSMEELARCIFNPGPGSLPRTSLRASPMSMDKSAGPDVVLSALDSLEGFVIGLYNEAFNAVVSLINRSMSSNYRSKHSIIVLDTPGFQNPSSCGKVGGATFEDLCHNYTQERLQLLFHDSTFTSQQDKYSQEDIDCDFDTSSASPLTTVELIDKQTNQSLVRSNPDLREYDQRGLLWLLDEEAIFPGATDDTFMERLLMHHGEHQEKRRKPRHSIVGGSLLQKGPDDRSFILTHLHGTTPVVYNVTGWLRMCRENPITKMATQILMDSQRSNISHLFSTIRGPISSIMTGSVAGIESSSSLRRASSIRRGYVSGAAGLKRKSVCLQVKFQVDAVIETIRRSKIHFIHCLLPQKNAGLCELRTPLHSPGKATPADDMMLDVPLVRAQIRSAEILDAVRMHRQGFPEHMLFSEFRRRFEVLIPQEARPNGPTVDEKEAVAFLLNHVEVDKNSYRLGLSQVFFRSGALAQLEDSRDNKVTGTILAFQKFCRGYLARQNLKKLQVQHLAVRCIQRNWKKFMLVREWPWWKIYTKVKPVLNVHKTEEELKERVEELESLKMKLEKLEKEKTSWKQHCDKLETKLAEVTADLSEEHTTSTHATEMLESETAERLRLEKELKELQAKHSALHRKSEQLEMEVMQSRLWSASAIDGEDLDDVDGSDFFRQKYERAIRELDFTKRKMQQQQDELGEQQESIRKQLERKLHESIAEQEEVRTQSANYKRKSQRLNQELQDMKLHLEEQQGRNGDLEKRQRRFDSELHKVTSDLHEEKIQREKLQREKDSLASENFSLQKDKDNLKMEFELQNEKIDRLERELRDLSSSGSKDDVEIMNLKRSKHELEMKVKDQEEELDDQAGQIQQLEQAKLRLEMNTQKIRQQHSKELEEKETELEEMRFSTQKRVKQLEVQLEEEYEERQKVSREKRDLERQIQELGERAPKRNKENEKRLRKDLRKTKALLRDAQTMLEKNKDGASQRTTVKQLRNQLEDAEFATAAAVKARKGIEIELQDLQQQLEDLTKAKIESDDRCSALSREKTEAVNALEDLEEEMAELLKKYKSVVQQQSVDQITLTDQSEQIEALQHEREILKEQVASVTSKVEFLETNYVDKQTVIRNESKIRDLESRLDLETTTKQRTEVQLNKAKESIERLTAEKDNIVVKEQQGQEVVKRLQRQLRDLREEYGETQKREVEATQRKHDLEIKVESLEGDYEQSQTDLKLAFKRIADLQTAIEDEMETDSDFSDSDADDDSSDEDIDTFLMNHHQKPLGRAGSGSLSSLENSPSRGRSLSAISGTSIGDEDASIAES